MKPDLSTNQNHSAMRIHRRRRRGQQAKAQGPVFQANEQITSEDVYVITDTGERIGEMKKEAALKLANEREVDLVMVSPKAKPPVVKLMDFGQFKYQKEKQARKQKAQSKQTETKSIRLSARIGEHDRDVRMKRALEFFKRGDKVKLEIVLRGREKAHAERGREVMEEFIKILKEVHEIEVNIEQAFTRQGARLTMVIGMK
ncbi:translation initiation factor IF-3 [Candidatus Uhrbacteria bacterium]|jgi:translation initiation factor IF-3|nr:translation initiation factor IF-3 [Candidatus Uhrbacteria bacterium]